MFWLAVRAEGIASEGVTEVPGLADPLPPPLARPVPEPAEPDGAMSGVAEGVTEGGAEAGAEALALTDGLADGLANSVWLAGTSSRKVWKILLSSGWVHSTLAVSAGSTSERGEVGRVKNATLLDGRLRRLEARLYRPVAPPSLVSMVRDLVAASRN